MNEIVFEKDTLSFEDFKNEKGICFWWASDLMKMLGYKDIKTFGKVIEKTTKAFLSLAIKYYDNIIPCQREIDKINIQDFKLSRFACYLAVMNANSKKQQVASAQAYFAVQLSNFELSIQRNDQIDPLVIRGDIAQGNKSLASVASRSGVDNFAKFQNAGYLGMYNMSLWQLERKRNIQKGKLMEHMGRAELAANLFRITQTEQRIKSHQIKGQTKLEATHEQVGREVREIIIKNAQTPPESLPLETQLSEVKKTLKSSHTKMKMIDKKPNKKQNK